MYAAAKYRILKNVCGALAASNGLDVAPTQPGTQYTFYMGKGNNSRIVRRILKSRRQWVELDPACDDIMDANLIWT
jgi:hypothetical protein